MPTRPRPAPIRRPEIRNGIALGSAIVRNTWPSRAPNDRETVSSDASIVCIAVIMLNRIGKTAPRNTSATLDQIAIPSQMTMSGIIASRGVALMPEMNGLAAANAHRYHPTAIARPNPSPNSERLTRRCGQISPLANIFSAAAAMREGLLMNSGWMRPLAVTHSQRARNAATDSRPMSRLPLRTIRRRCRARRSNWATAVTSAPAAPAGVLSTGGPPGIALHLVLDQPPDPVLVRQERGVPLDRKGARAGQADLDDRAHPPRP